MTSTPHREAVKLARKVLRADYVEIPDAHAAALARAVLDMAAELERLHGRDGAWTCARCKKPMQFYDGLCWRCYGGGPGQ